MGSVFLQAVKFISAILSDVVVDVIVNRICKWIEQKEQQKKELD